MEPRALFTIFLFLQNFFKINFVDASACTSPSVSCYSDHYLAKFNLCECCQYSGSDVTSYQCTQCFQISNNLAGQGPPGLQVNSYFIMGSDNQVCERTTKGTGPDSLRSPSNFAEMTSSTETTNLECDKPCMKCSPPVGSNPLTCSLCSTPFKAIQSSSSFKTSQCFYDCKSAFDISNTQGGVNRGIGTYESIPVPGVVDTPYCTTCNVLNNCLRCISQNSLGCTECPYSKERYSDSDANNFVSKSLASTLSCASYSNRQATLTKIYYIGPGTSTGYTSLTNVFSSLVDVINDLTNTQKIYKYLEIDIKIYFLKTTAGINNEHFILNVAPLLDSNPWSSDWKGRLFQRVSATVLISTLSSCAQAYCYAASEKATLVFKSSAALFYVTKSFTIQNIILDGSDLAAPASTSRVCQLDSNNEPAAHNSNCGGSIAPAYTVHSYTDFQGVFNFQFLPDYSSATMPSMTINNCIIRNFLRHSRARTFISMQSHAAHLTITNSVFTYNYFEVGLISNAISNGAIDAFVLHAQYTTSSSYTCKSFGHSFAGDCYSITISDSTFKYFNKKQILQQFSANSGLAQGMVLALVDFNGLIKISSSTFLKNLASVTQYTSFPNSKFNCDQLRQDSSETNFNPNRPIWNENIDIYATSTHKLYIDKHMRKILTSKPRRISSLIYLRNFKNSLAIYNNAFSYNVASFGSILFIEGFTNKKASNYYLIDNNKFKNNLAWGFGLTIVIMQISRDIISTQCNGISITSNSFENNIGCGSTFGNVIISCDASDQSSKTAKTTFESAPQQGGLDDFYENYNAVINLLNSTADSKDDPLVAKFQTFFDKLLPTYVSSTEVYTNPFTSTTFGKYGVVYSNNICFQNYAIISNCFYVQGALKVTVSDNTFRGNSASLKGFFQMFPYKDYEISAGTEALIYEVSENNRPKKSLMKESSPVVIRQASQVQITNSIFEENSAGFSGDYYFGAAITLHQLLGTDDIVIDSCKFKKHSGIPGYIKDVLSTEHKFEFCSFPLISFNYWTKGTGNQYVQFNKKANSAQSYLFLKQSDFFNNFFSIGAQQFSVTPSIQNKTRSDFNEFNSPAPGQYDNTDALSDKYQNVINSKVPSQYATILHYFDSQDEKVTSTNSNWDFDLPSGNYLSAINGLTVMVSNCRVQGNQNLNGNPLFSQYWFNLTISGLISIFNFFPESSSLFTNGVKNFAQINIQNSANYRSAKDTIEILIENSQFDLNYGLLLYVSDVSSKKGFTLKNVIITNHEVNTSAVIIFTNSYQITVDKVSGRFLRSKRGLLEASSVTSLAINELTVENSIGEEASVLYFSRQALSASLKNLKLKNNNIIPYFLTGVSYTTTIFQVLSVPPSAIVLSNSVISINGLTAENNTNIFTIGIMSSNIEIKSAKVFNYNVFQTEYAAFIWVSSACTASIISSEFSNINCKFCKGGVILAASATLLTINSSVFEKISSYSATSVLSNLTEIRLFNSTFQHNYASTTDSVMQVKLGSAIINNCTFYNNSALDFALISFSTASGKILNSLFSNNTANNFVKNLYTKESDNLEISSSTFQDYIIGLNTRSAFIFSIDTPVTLVNVILEGANSTYGAIYMQADNKLISIRESTLFNNFAYSEGGSCFVSCNVEIKFCKFINNSVNSSFAKASNIYITTTNSFLIESTYFSSFSRVAVYAEYITTLSVFSTEFQGSQSPSVGKLGFNQMGLYCLSCLKIIISQSNFKNLYSQDCGAGLSFDFSKVIGGSQLSLSINSSNFLDNTAKSNGGGVCLIYASHQSPTILIYGTNFKNNYAVDSGGALYYDSFNNASNLTLINCNISFNKAWSGGGFRFKGQKVYYDNSTLIYNNTARYGPNIASYGVYLREKSVVSSVDWAWLKEQASSGAQSVYRRRLVQDRRVLQTQSANFSSNFSNKSILQPVVKNVLSARLAPANPETDLPQVQQEQLYNELVSGQVMEPPVIIELVDEFGQVVQDDNSSSLTITTTDNKLKFNEKTSFNAYNGRYIMYPFSLTYTPSSKTIMDFSSTGIIIVPNREFPNKFVLKTKISIESPIRDCIRNERKTDSDQCIPCLVDQYNVFPRDALRNCEACDTLSYCQGGDLVGPKQNFWRFSGMVSTYLECLNSESCAGAILSSSANEASHFCKTLSSADSRFCITGWCEKGYKGNLCQTCIDNYAKSNEIYCVPCTNNPQYYILTVIIIVVAVLFIIFTIWKSLRPKKKKAGPSYNKGSIMLKILINYFQLVSIVSSFNFRWPGEVQDTFAIQNKVAGSSAQIFSIDCVLQSSAGDSNQMSMFFLKLAFIAISPLIFLIICIVCWLLIFLKRYGSRLSDHKEQLRTNITVSIIVVLFMIHTTIVKNSIMAFRCQNMGNDDGSTVYLMERDLDLSCWEGEHLKYVLLIALPSLVIWGFGIPFAAYVHIRRNRNQLEEPSFKDSFGFLYDGYKKRKYYWEFVILYRKIVMIFISVFMVTIKIEIQAVCVLGVSFLSYLMHIDSNPFVDSDLNKAEKNALISATFTLYAGLYYLAGMGTWSGFLLYVLIVIVNCIFGLAWLRGFLREQLLTISRTAFGQKLMRRFPFIERFAESDVSSGKRTPQTVSMTPDITAKEMFSQDEDKKLIADNTANVSSFNKSKLEPDKKLYENLEISFNSLEISKNIEKSDNELKVIDLTNPKIDNENKKFENETVNKKFENIEEVI